MSLSSLQLDAFLSVARTGSFSEAATKLGITQSALSQRVLNLEAELERTLFLRESSGTRLSEEGESLLRYAQAKESLESEFLRELGAGGKKDQAAGLVRVAGFSTIVRSVLLPQLALLGRKHPALRFEVLTREVREIPALLRSGRVDLALSSEPLERAGYESQRIGWEENVLVESTRHKPLDVYLDHDEDDTTTRDFWKLQKNPPKNYERAYFDEAYALLDAVVEGLGRAVLPRHWLSQVRGVAEVPGLKALRVPVYLLRPERAYRPQTHEIVSEMLKRIFQEAT